MDPSCEDKEAVRQFAVRLFDPILGGVVQASEFELVIRELFASETELLQM